MNQVKRIRDYLKTHGTGYTIRRLGQKAMQRYLGTYDRRRKREACGPEELQRQRENPPAGGLISVVIPVYNTNPEMLKALVESLRNQSYESFEAVLYDGCSTKKETREVLKSLEAGGDSRFRVIWGEENRGISGNTNEAIRYAKGEFAALCDHDDLLAPDALWRVAECIEQEQPDMVYTDEDRVTENGKSYMDPHYKPDFCPDNLNSDNYICHLSVIRKSILEEIGGLRSGFDGSQDHDLILRVSERTNRICHLPHTLYTWREVGSSMSHLDLNRCLEAGCRAVTEHEEKMGRRVTARPVNKEIRLWYEIPENAAVEAIIHGPTEKACKICFRELKERVDWKNLSFYPAAAADGERIRAVNRAVARSDAEYLLVLDSRVREMNREMIRELMMYAMREDAAGVTPILTDRRGKISHGGYALGMEGTVQCINEGMLPMAGGWHDMMNKVHNVSAVSLGCFLVRRDNWIPLDEGYRGGMGMADLGLRQRKNGKWFVLTPHARACMEPCELLLNRRARWRKESVRKDAERLAAEWGKEIRDPCYSGRFGRKKANYHF